VANITAIKARQVLDSRGNPTVEADVMLEGGAWGRSSVPSGASTGKREALELRDGDQSYYMGKSVLKAVGHINESLGPALVGIDGLNQREVDERLLKLDGTANKEKYGANALLAISMANCRAQANAKKKTLFRYMADHLEMPNPVGALRLPTPLMNIINGGAHASNNLDIQEFMIAPHIKGSFSDNLRAGVEVFHHLKKVLEANSQSTNVGDEGGFAPNLESHEQAIEFILLAIKNAGYKPGEDISLSLDSAASEFFSEGSYKMQGKKLTSEDMVKYYSDLCEKYPIYSIEDGLAEEDFSGWQKLTAALGDKVLLVGDDLFVTNKAILEVGIKEKQANSILIKVNQIGTLTETFETLKLAFDNNFEAIISHRSGETGDSFIADLAVACGAGHIKTGSASRSDRMEKYNQLLRIEEELGKDARFDPIA